MLEGGSRNSSLANSNRIERKHAVIQGGVNRGCNPYRSTMTAHSMDSDTRIERLKAIMPSLTEGKSDNFRSPDDPNGDITANK